MGELPNFYSKIERSHRTDEVEFYCRFTFTSPGVLRRLLRDWEHEYNHLRPHLTLHGKAPADALCELRIHPPRLVLDSA